MKEYKKNLIKEINELGNNLIKIKTEVGIFMIQNQIQNISEKIIFLKVYDSLNFNSNENIFIEDKLEKLNSNENLSLELKLNYSKNNENTLSEDNIKLENPNEIIPSEVDLKSENPNEIIPSEINDKKIFPKIELNLDDKIDFTAKLFGDLEKCKIVIETLNYINNLNDSLILFDEIKNKFNWTGKEEYSNRLKKIIENRFS